MLLPKDKLIPTTNFYLANVSLIRKMTRYAGTEKYEFLYPGTYTDSRPVHEVAGHYHRKRYCKCK